MTAPCAICLDIGAQCLECEEAGFRDWAERYFAKADYRKTSAGVFIQDWMRHAYSAWCARGALEKAAEAEAKREREEDDSWLQMKDDSER